MHLQVKGRWRKRQKLGEVNQRVEYRNRKSYMAWALGSPSEYLVRDLLRTNAYSLNRDQLLKERELEIGRAHV